MLIARNGPKLDERVAGVRERHGVEARPLVLDLTDQDVGERVAEATDGLEVGLLIYNAGPRTGRWSFSTTRSRIR